MSHLTRRRFVQTTVATALVAPFFTRHLMSAPPSGILRHASFGSAGMAWADIQALCANPFVKLVAVAEVDLNRIGPLKERFPEVKVYQDWRQLLDKEQNAIDSVNVSTPDHLHAPIAYSAMQLGKHVYCQKPLSHDLHETRLLTEFARQKGVVTQMGIQRHTGKNVRRTVALLRSGAIGKLREVHAWTSNIWGDRGAPPAKSYAVPAGFDWDLWLGGCENRPYIGDSYYHPEHWRKRLDFGTGNLGDMGCHIFSSLFEVLDRPQALTVRSEGAPPDAWSWAPASRVHYTFKGSSLTEGKTLPVTWYDAPQGLPAEVRDLFVDPKDSKRLAFLKDHGHLVHGALFVGTEGMLHAPLDSLPQLYPLEKFKGYSLEAPPATDHWADWATACIGGPTRPAAPFDFSGPLTESVLIGSVAARFPNTTLGWDAAGLRFTNLDEANAFLRKPYRKEWSVPGLG